MIVLFTILALLLGLAYGLSGLELPCSPFSASTPTWCSIC